MRIDYIQQGVVGRSEFANPQRLINFYPELDKSGRAVMTLHGTEGLTLIDTIGDGPIRGALEYDTLAYWVSGDGFYTQTAANVFTLIGNIATTEGFVSMATDGLYVMLIDFEGGHGWTYEIASGTFAQVTDVHFPTNPVTVAVCTGYFLVNDQNTQRIHYATDPTSWAALDFFSAEKSPDDVVAVIEDKSELVILGTRSIELWRLGTSWEPISGGQVDFGCAARGSPAKMDNSIYWLDEQGVVRALRGTTAPRVSSHSVEYRISQHSRAEIRAARAYTYTPEGHSFYVLHVGDETFVYDAAIPDHNAAWHQRAYLVESTGVLIQHRGLCHAYFNSLDFVGDFENGKVYRFNSTSYTDAGDPLQSTATYKPILNQGKPVFIHRLETEVEPGVGKQTGQGLDPMIELGISYDGGKVWEPWDQRIMGPVGQYRVTCTWDGLGSSRNTVFELRITDPVKRCISNTYLEVTPGR